MSKDQSEHNLLDKVSITIPKIDTSIMYHSKLYIFVQGKRISMSTQVESLPMCLFSKNCEESTNIKKNYSVNKVLTFLYNRNKPHQQF